MTDTWGDIIARLNAQPEPSELKSELSYEYVLMEEYDVVFEERDGRMMCLCPFHPDSAPSFAVYADGERGGCWSCGWQGDVFDVIRAKRDVSFSRALIIGAAMLTESSGFTATVIPQAVIDPETLHVTAQDAWKRGRLDSSPLKRFALAKGLMPQVDWLVEQFHLGVMDENTIVIPHMDWDGNFTGYKTRTPWSPTIAARGSKLPALYAAWRDQGLGRVLICEGESDVWTATKIIEQLGVDIDVFGLPTGAGQGKNVREAWLLKLENRTVYTAFDGDDAGMKATTAWRSALPTIPIALPNGQDIRSDPEWFRNRVMHLPIG